MGEVWLPHEYRPPRVVVVLTWPGMSDNGATPFPRRKASNDTELGRDPT
jgi:hypothetical protein